MVRWVKRLAAVGNGILVLGLLFPMSVGIATVGCLLNLLWTGDEWFPWQVSRFFRRWALLINTGFLVYGVLGGGLSILGLFSTGSSLLAWNAGLFLERWGDGPLPIQYQYLRRVGTLVALGLLAGFSALSFQGSLVLSFSSGFLLMLIAGFLCLHMISRALRKESVR